MDASRRSARGPSEGADVAIVNASSRYALLALQGPAGRTCAPDAHRHRPGGDQVPTGTPSAKSPARARPCREPATRVKTGSRCSCRRPRPSGRGTPSSRPAGQRASSRAASARATRCASRRRCACAAATWTSRRRCSKPGLGWIVGWKKDDVLWRRTPARAKGRRRSLASSSPFEMTDRAIARHGHHVMHGDVVVGRRHERDADALS